MRAAEPTIRRRPSPTATRLASLAALAVLSACAGGSGSSGFDISPSAERALIARALDEGTCVDAGATVICPTERDGLTVNVPNHPSVPTIEGVSLSTGVSEDSEFPCNKVSPIHCIIEVEIETSGLPEGAWMQVVWRQDDRGPWLVRLDGQPLQQNGRTAARMELPVECTAVQVAVLVFLDGVPIVQGRLDTLAEAQAPIAFVKESLPIRVEFPDTEPARFGR